jgi:hypothetical protein
MAMSKLQNRIYNIFGGIALVAGITAFLTSAPIAMITFIVAASISGAASTGLGNEYIKAKFKPGIFFCSAAATAAATIAFLPAAQPLRQRIKDVFSKTAQMPQKHEKSAAWDAKTTANPYGLKSV